jgi:hypothetical protein
VKKSNWLDRRRAPFETAASRLRQDEEYFLMPSTNYLMLRSAFGRVSKRARIDAAPIAAPPLISSHTLEPTAVPPIPVGEFAIKSPSYYA